MRIEGNAFLRLKANPKYWGGKPAFETVVFKFVTDATSRVAEIESGSSDVTLEMPYEEYDRLKAKPGLAGRCHPDLRHRHDLHQQRRQMLDKNVRLAAAPRDRQAGDRQAPAARLRRADRHAGGAGIRGLRSDHQGRRYDPDKAAKLLAASGFSPQKPVKFTIQTTRGFKPKDYEMIQAIVGMWRKVGIEADIEVYEIAKHFELRTAHKLAPAAFYNWGNAIGDPIDLDRASPCSARRRTRAGRATDLDAKIGPLWGEKDEAKRIAGWKAVDRYIAEQGYVIPLLQYVQPILYKADLKVTPNVSGAMQPHAGRQDQGLTSSVAARSGTPMTASDRNGDDRCPQFVKRVAMAIVTLFGVAVVVFVLLRVVPGDPIAMMIAPGASAARHRRAARPLWARPAAARAVRASGSAACCTAISASRSRCAGMCSNCCIERLPATLELAIVAGAWSRSCSAARSPSRGTLMRRSARRGGDRCRQRARARGAGFRLGARRSFCSSACCGRCCRCPAASTRASTRRSRRTSICSRACSPAASASPRDILATWSCRRWRWRCRSRPSSCASSRKR